MRRAESWLEIGRYPLSRRDRATMELALHALRRGGVNMALQILRTADWWGAARDLRGLLEDEQHALIAEKRASEHQLLRARAALALRTLLRVDRGDIGACEWYCSEQCGAGGTVSYRLARDGRRCGYCDAGIVVLDRLAQRPLWESAPPHEVSR